MRMAYNQSWIKNDEGAIIGICLGYDHCAEHEWGIAQMETALGMNKDLFGVDRRKMTKGFENTIFVSKTLTRTIDGVRHRIPAAALVFESSDWRLDQVKEEYVKNPPSGMKLYDYLVKRVNDPDKRIPVESSWSKDGFSVTAYGKDAVAVLKRIHEAMSKEDLCVSLSGRNNPFAGTGLCLTIRSEIPQSVQDSVLAADLDYAELTEAAKATGVEAALKAAGRTFYALSPRWKNKDTKEVVFWLNPSSQNRYNAGWFTPSELLEWIDEKGPVIKKDNEA